MGIRDLIADEINEHRNRRWYGCVTPREIKRVEVRKGCAEIDVEYLDGGTDADPAPSRPPSTLHPS